MPRLWVLMENEASSPEYACEHGLSFFLEADGAAILFDTGKSGAFLRNAQRMGCDVAGATHIVLSHGHYDHTGGLGAALEHIAAHGTGKKQPPVFAHPDALRERRKPLLPPLLYKDLGMPASARKKLASWPTRLSKDPVRLTENIVFLGEIPPLFSDARALVGEAKIGGAYAKDELPDDSALACITDKGLVIVAGCSHSGVRNIMERAKAVTGVKKIRAVYGGLHCKTMSPATLAQTKEALLAEGLEELYACHCSGGALRGFPGALRLAAGQSHALA